MVSGELEQDIAKIVTADTLVVDASVAALWVLERRHWLTCTSSPRARSIAQAVPEKPLRIDAAIGAALAVAIGAAGAERDAVDLRGCSAAATASCRTQAACQRPELSLDLDHPIYDCFSSRSPSQRCALVSADARLLSAAKRAKGIEIRQLLGHNRHGGPTQTEAMDR